MRRVWIIGLVAFLGLAALVSTFGLGTIRASVERAEAEAGHVHTLEVLLDTARLTSSLEAMQRGQRGFLLTGDPAYLDPYFEGARQEDALRRRLRREMSDNPRQRADIAALDRAVDGLSAALAQTISLAQTGRTEAALALVRTGEGRQRMREIQAIIDRINDEEARLLALRAEAADIADLRVWRYTTGLTVLGVLLLALSTVLGLVALRRHIERAEIDNLLRTVLASIQGAVFAKDAEGRYTLMSEVGAKLFGRPVADILGRTDAEIQPPLFAEQAAEHESRAAAHGGPLHFEETVDIGGKPVHLSITRTPLHGLEGEVAGAAGVAIDVTAWKRSEATLAERDDMLRRVETRQGFLLALEDRLRNAPTARAAVTAACEALGLALGARFVGVGELQDDNEHTFVESEWRASPDVPSTLGRHRQAETGAERFAAMLAGDTVLVEDAATDPRTAGPDAQAIYAGFGARASLDVPLMRAGRPRAFLFVALGHPHAWTDDEVALARETLDRAWHAAERARAEAALVESETRLRAILDALPIGVVVCEAPSGRVLLGNGAVETIVRHPVLPSSDIAGHRDWEAYHDDGRRVEGTEYPVGRVLASGEPAEGEYHYRRGDGTMAWVRLIAAPIRDAEGRMVAAVVGIVDIDELKRLTQHQALLMAELSHRVKNALAVVQGIASQTIARATSLEEFRQAFEGRLQALSTAHALLLRTNWQGLSVAGLVDAVLAPYRSERLEVAAGPDVQLEAQKGVALALILHELATNAAKYGALAAPDGRLRVEWAQEWRNGQPWLRLRWAEGGLPAPPKTDREGFGTKLIRRSTEHDLDGTAVRTIGPDRVLWELEFQLAWTQGSKPH